MFFCIGLLLVGLFLYTIRETLAPFLYALVLTYILAPLVDLIRKKGLNKVAAILFLYIAVGVLLVLLFFCVVPFSVSQLNEFGDMVPVYAKEIQGLFNQGERLYSRMRLPVGLRHVTDELIKKVEKTVLDYVRSVADFTLFLLSQILAIIIAPILAFYMLRDMALIKTAFQRMLPANLSSDFSHLVQELDEVLGGFIRGHLLVSLIVGILSFVGLTFLRINFALLISIIAGIFDIIPYFGPIIGALPAMIIALLQSPIKAAYVALLFLIIHQAESTIITPKILGEKVGLHPLVVIFVILAGGKLAGIAGIVLAVPVTAVIKVFICFAYHKGIFDTKLDQSYNKEN